MKLQSRKVNLVKDLNGILSKRPKLITVSSEYARTWPCTCNAVREALFPIRPASGIIVVWRTNRYAIHIAPSIHGHSLFLWRLIYDRYVIRERIRDTSRLHIALTQRPTLTEQTFPRLWSRVESQTLARRLRSFSWNVNEKIENLKNRSRKRKNHRMPAELLCCA